MSIRLSSNKTRTIMLAVVFALALTLSLGGCGGKYKLGGEPEVIDVRDARALVDDEIAEDDMPGDDAFLDDENEILEFYEEGEWPDNEFTKQIPEPDFDVGDSFLLTNGFTTTFRGVTLDEAREYGEALQAAGFTINLDIYDFTGWEDALRNSPEMGEFTDDDIKEFLAELEMDDLDSGDMYTFEAENSAGYFVEFFWDEDMEILFTMKRV